MDHSESTSRPQQDHNNFPRDQPPRGPRGTRLLILLPAALAVVALMAAWVWVEDFLPESERLPPPLHESWNILSIDGVRVGGSHQRQWQIRQDGQPRIMTEASEYLRVLRQGQTVRLEVSYRCEETPTGQLLVCRSWQQTDDGPPVIQTAEVARGQLYLRQLLATGQSERTIDWPPATRGYFGIEASLRQQMLVPGERRQLHYLVPLLNQIAQVDLHAAQFETVELASGLTRLLRIDSTSHHGGFTTRQTLWCDGAGEVIRSIDSAMNLTSERTTREVAEWKAPAPQYDIMTGSRVPVEPAIENPRDQAQLVYQVQLRDHSPAEAFAKDERQQVEPIDHRRALLTVHAAWLAAGKDVALAAETQQPAAPHAKPTSHPDAQTLAPSRFIQSDDPLIVALAGRVLAGQDGPSVQQVAVGLERLVHDWIDKKSYQQIFSSAREVYQSRRGDCTEHAVLLAAVCRARKIPARLALGLVYVPEQQGFLFHLWTEGWWDQRWHGLDATLGRGGIGATHLKLRAFTLADDNLLAEMATVSQVIGQLEIRVVTKTD